MFWNRQPTLPEMSALDRLVQLQAKIKKKKWGQRDLLNLKAEKWVLCLSVKKVCGKWNPRRKFYVWYILLREKKRNMAYRWLFYEWKNKVINTESVKKVCGK